MKKGTVWVIGGIGAALAVGASVLVSREISKNLIRIAVEREAPKSMGLVRSRMDTAGSMVDINAVLREKSLQLEKQAKEEIKLRSRDGETLIGHWCPCEEPKRVIVAMHGWRSCWSRDFGSIAPFWHDNGCSVLYAEQRGQNKSSGAYITFGLMERYDCLDWIQWVRDRVGEDVPIYLCGISMGASTVLMATELDLPANVHGVIADCGFTSPHAIWKHVVTTNLHLPYNPHRKAINDLFIRKFDTDITDFSTLSAMKCNKTPVLFVHGAEDHFVPIGMTYQNYMACRAPRRLLVVPGARHGMSYCVDQETYERVTKDFWRDFDECR